MEEKQSIIAAGAGAQTKLALKEAVLVPGSKKKKMTRLLRIENVKDVAQYIERIDEMISRKEAVLLLFTPEPCTTLHGYRPVR